MASAIGAALHCLPLIIGVVRCVPSLSHPLIVHPSIPKTFDDTNITNPTSINITLSKPLSVWPKIPYWSKIEADPPTFLDVYSIGPELDSRQAYVLQELVLLPLSFKLFNGPQPASSIEDMSYAGVRAMYVPNEHRAPQREVAAKAMVALAFLEKTFGARALKAGLRLGMVKVASIEVRLDDGETVSQQLSNTA